MNLREIDSKSRKDVNAFIQFPVDLYQECPNWFPPLASTVAMTMNRQKHPFYKHSDAAFFLAETDNQPCGRIAVLENRRYNTYHNSKTAFFYYFDAINDEKVGQALFAAASEWAEKRGLDKLLGPKGLLRSDAPGILVEGFEHRAALSMPYNYDYYPTLAHSAGLEKEVDFLSGYIETGYELPERIIRVVEKVKERRGFWVKTFTSKRELRAWIPKIQKVNNDAFVKVWGYYPIDADESEMIGKQLLSIADPRLLKILMKGDDVIGFAFVFPDISDALKATGGQLWPWGWIRILKEFKQTRRLSGNGIGLLPEYQGMGGSAMLYMEFSKTLRDSNAVHCDIAQTLENNIKSLGDMNALQVNWYKRHRVYQRSLKK